MNIISFLLGKEQNHQEFTASDKEIEKLVAQMQELENRSNEVLETVSWLEKQLQRIKKVVRELKENEEGLQEQQYNNKIQMSAYSLNWMIQGMATYRRQL